MQMEMPRIVRVRQVFERPKVLDVPAETASEFARLGLGKRVSGKRVGITVGSRGIADILPILRALVGLVRANGGEPILLAAMGSHGGGTEEGQLAVLRSLGITSSALDAPVEACAKSLEIGATADGLKAYILETAMAVDAILPVNRVKVHTAFHGVVESGLYKMLVVGLGGPKGAAQFHGEGSARLADLLLGVGDVILDKMPVIAGFAIVENAYEETAMIRGVPASAFRKEEPEILDYARSLLPSLPTAKLDALVIEEMGKNYSGTGVDTNVIGRLRIEGVPEPEAPAIQKIAVLDLSEESHGNANGIGLMDVTTKKLVDKIDRKATYLNCETTGFLMRGATPVFMDTEQEAIELMIRSLGTKPVHELRMIQIPNTLHLDECYATVALLPELRTKENVEIFGKPEPVTFGERGELVRRILRPAAR
jgi:hypothetical protein